MTENTSQRLLELIAARDGIAIVLNPYIDRPTLLLPEKDYLFFKQSENDNPKK